MFEEWMANERNQERLREIEQLRRIHEALACEPGQLRSGSPVRVRVGRWLIASGQRLIDGVTQ